ncbi:acyl-CoA dehydrogenase [Metarhizium album ARSEF 1941]|uniref:Acyl-CoA dehydrogenase n=1 Tax=Metarhizium album (strain ARSEF 1941) TaxID=1081103 RepID=A0A0B2WTY2_METAS|nr:acyl-CoA dehydrogenase [Metarhizium album ARSEF 1941]KHN96922.1 acyl-CoA dehydrogenase [Metarhizium album ARSEF 1941]
MEPSSADGGFFQEAPVLRNQFDDDASFQRCFKLFLSPEVASRAGGEVSTLGRDVISDQVFTWVAEAEHNKPYLRGSGRDAFGKWKGELVTGEGWRSLRAFGQSRGMVATGYDTPYGAFARPLQFLRTHLWVGSCANVGCPSAMQDGAACLLRRHLTHPELSAALSAAEKRVFADAYGRLTSRDAGHAWTSGQWMTERTGGSDVSLTETVATYRPDGADGLASRQGQIPLGPWSISGFKWFSSATDAEMAVLLARTAAGGLSAFLAPMRRHDAGATTLTGEPREDGTVLNGVRIQRLKNKLGTQSLPTAELVLDNMRGWMVGREGGGIHEISTILTLTRVHSAVAAVGGVGRGLGIARAYALVRHVGAGKRERTRLVDSPLHMRTLANMSAEYRGLMLVTFYTSYVLGVSEHSLDARPPPALEALTPQTRSLAGPLLRIMTQLAKAYVCKPSVALLFSCMESLGGVGYLVNEEQEYLNVARIYRDTCVLPIWEGTTDVLCTDLIRAMKHTRRGADSLAALDEVIRKAWAFQGNKIGQPPGWKPVERWAALKAKIEGTPQADLMGEARELVWQLGHVLCSLLLYVDAGTDGSPAAKEVFVRFVEDKFAGVRRRPRGRTEEELAKDRAIVYGDGGAAAAKL